MIEQRGDGLPPLSELFARLGDVLVVRSGMGSGKTARFLEHVAGLPVDARVLVLANRLSILRNLAGRAAGNLSLHADTRGCLASVPRLLCTVESLPRLLDADRRLPTPYDLVVIDELPATLAQLLSPTVRDAPLAAEVLRAVTASARRIVALAADAEAPDANLLGALAARGVGYYVNTSQPDAGDLHLHRAREEWEAEVTSRLAAGQRAFLASDSRRTLESLLRRLQPVLEGRRVRTYAAGYGAEAAAELSDPNVSWVGYDVVATTPVITHGVDFSVWGHFAFVGYVCAGASIVPRAVVQTLRRVRFPSERLVLFLALREDVEETGDGPALSSTEPHRYVTDSEGRVVPDSSDPLTLLALKSRAERVDRRHMVAEVSRRWTESGGSVIVASKPTKSTRLPDDLSLLGFTLGPDGTQERWIDDGEMVPADSPFGLPPLAPLVKTLRARLHPDRTIKRERRLRRPHGYENLYVISNK